LFLSYAVTAEARALESLGIPALGMNWNCLLIEYKMLKNHAHEYMYGWVKTKKSGWIRSAAPAPEWESDNGDSNAEVENNLSSALKNMLDLEIDTDHKDAMRERIIAGGPFTDAEREAISRYCDEDTAYLPALALALFSAQERLIAKPARVAALPSERLKRGRFAADMARCERVGLPLNIDRVNAISANHDGIAARVIEEANTVYPFWVKETKGKNKGKYTQKYDAIRSLIEGKEWHTWWPKTESGRYSTEEKVLDDYKGYAEIAAFRNAKKTLQQIKWFRPDALPAFYSRVGSDNRIRPYYNPFGTQTGRNAPPAKGFPLAMSSWLRCIITPPKGKVIISRDYSSQEFYIAAWISRDKNMLGAYNSGDPYLWFGKEAGAIPPHGTKESHGEIRDLMKGTCLGTQFSMGYRKLASKLTSDTGKEVTHGEAKQLLAMHRNSFPVYYEMLNDIDYKYQDRQPLRTKDGWYLFCDNPRPTSVRNFPVQGNGAAILRAAVRRCHELGLVVLCPLHDAIYVEADEADAKEAEALLGQAMAEAVTEVLGKGAALRGDNKIITHEEPWVEKKGKVMYEKLKPYIDDTYSVLY
jgi:hypothetical protein